MESNELREVFKLVDTIAELRKQLRQTRTALEHAVEVLDADGICFGTTASDLEPLDVTNECRDAIARLEGI